jgi:hypothetical protein
MKGNIILPKYESFVAFFILNLLCGLSILYAGIM